jgi:dihydroflavonol-4-reductase
LTILVTGASGFLGSSFVRRALADGHEVTALVRRPAPALDSAGITLVVADVRHVDASVTADVDALVHFATATSGHDSEVVETAVQGTLAMLEAALAGGVSKFVHISSMSAYGVTSARGTGGEIPLESDPQGRGAYARAKILAEQALRKRVAERALSAIDVAVLRPGFVFGDLTASPLSSSVIELPGGLAVGRGRAEHAVPVVDVEDLNTAILALLDGAPVPGRIRTYDVLSRVPSKSDFIALHRRLTGRPVRTVWVPAPLAAAIGTGIDAVQRVRERPMRARKSVRRLYDFDPRVLPWRRLWGDLGLEPQADERKALLRALGGKRRPLQVAERGRGRTEISELARTASSCVAPTGKPIPTVVVGAGRIASEMHAAALHALPRLRVGAVVDTNVARARALASQLGALAVPTVEELDENLLRDGLGVVATPGDTHAALAVELLDRGASVVIEKPAATTLEGWEMIVETAARSERPVSIVQNYRLRPAAMRLWHFLATHEVGPLRGARLVFRTPRVHLEPARWMRDEKRHRALLMELGVHFLDLAFVVGGEIDAVEHLVTEDDSTSAATVRIEGSAILDRGGRLTFELDASGDAQRTQLLFEFERATCVLDFFPDGFRILPRRSNPLDDFFAVGARTKDALLERLQPAPGIPRRVLPHWRIYAEHLRMIDTPAARSPFSVEALEPTMRSLETIAERVYEIPGTPA